MINNSSSIIPFGLDEWTLTDNVNLLEDPIEKLSKDFYIRIGRDYHGCGIHEKHSLFTYITDTKQMKLLLNRFGENVVNYTNRTGGNVLHDIVINPNMECYYVFKNAVTEDDLFMLANKVNKYDEKPIENVNTVILFEELLKYTDVTPSVLLSCMRKNYGVQKHICDKLCDFGVINL